MTSNPKERYSRENGNPDFKNFKYLCLGSYFSYVGQDFSPALVGKSEGLPYKLSLSLLSSYNFRTATGTAEAVHDCPSQSNFRNGFCQYQV
jgi:hypothetical protein